MTKSELRRTYLAKRRAISDAELTEKSQQIADNFFSNVDLSGVNTLHTFISIQRYNEMDTSFIYERVWRDHPEIVTAAPRADLTNCEMENAVFTKDTIFSENRWGIREPVTGATIAASEIDMVLVPLFCFDTNGHRVGYGKAFYDKFLSKCRPDCVKVGLSYFPPVAEISDLGTHDVMLDRCITPERIHEFGGRKNAGKH